jgi:2-polyprenyl-6-methoxyphenol hydroxylase-like FAD-dependent oxidoreductase
MIPRRQPTYDVIVAGAGPVGLTVSIDLGRRGVRCLIIGAQPDDAARRGSS